MSRTTLKRLGIAVACGLIGLALNIWRTGSTTPLLFGRLMTLPIAILWGPWYGLLSESLIGLAARGPFSVAIPFLALEAVVVGSFAQRGRSPLLGGVIVWVTAGAGVYAAPELIGAGYTRATIVPLALQVIISGLVGVVIGDLIATGASARRLVEQDARPAQRIRSYAFHAFVLVATLPVLLLAAVDSQLSATKQEGDASARLREAVTALDGHVGAYVADHMHAVRALAASVGPAPPPAPIATRCSSAITPSIPASSRCSSRTASASCRRSSRRATTKRLR